MLWHTHVAIGAAAAIASLPAQVSTKEAIIAASVNVAAALIPDIDTPHSKIGSKHRLHQGLQISYWVTGSNALTARMFSSILFI